MARYSATVRRSRRSSRKASWLPEGLQVFIARRLMDAAAAVLALAGLFILTALVSYNAADPSLNTASAAAGDDIHNWLGLPGAYTADLLLQGLGLGGAMFGLIFLAWGVRAFRRDPLSPLWLRLTGLLLTAGFAAAAFARLPAGTWLPHPWLGGSAGTLMLDRFSILVPGILPFPTHAAAAVAAGVLSFAAFLLACAVRRDEIGGAFRMMGASIVFCANALFGVVMSFAEWVRRYNDPDYAPRAKPALRVGSAPRRAPRIEDTDEDGGESSEALPEITAPIHLSASRKPEQKKKKDAPAKQRSLALTTSYGDWELPPLDLLQDAPAEDEGSAVDESGLRKNAELLQSVLQDFNVQGDIVSIHPGPVVTLYELEPAPGIKTSRIISLSDDIARSMAAISVRCAVIPGRNVIGIELPNKRRQTVYLRQLLEMPDVRETRMALPLVLGKDIGGHPVVADLTRMPHLLVAGTTGSGKSVAVNTMILSLLYRLPPEKCRFIMIDPKMLELSVYDDIPHLLAPVVTEPGKAVVALKWTVNEMEERYRAMSKLGVRNIEGYNIRLAEARRKGETLMRKVQTGYDSESGKPVYEEQPMDMTELPHIVVVVDEFADLMLVAGKDVENAVQRLAQMARAAGIHLIMATQRPSVDVITGVIKANFPTRISFQVTSKIDSRTILGDGGAEQLLGMGDMLYMAPGGRITRVHGPFVTDDEVEDVVKFLKKQGEPAYVEDITEGGFQGGSDVMNALFGGAEGGGSSVDEFYEQAVALVARERKASTSFVQRHFQIGYNRAARIVEEMERQGIVSPANRVGKREVLVGDYSDA